MAASGIFYFIYYFVLFWGVYLTWSLALVPRQKCSGMIIAHYGLQFPGSTDHPTSASQVVETTGVHQHALLLFKKKIWRWGLTLLPRLVSKSWPQVILLNPWPPKMLGL